MREINLINIGGGAAVEMFGRSLEKVLTNIADPNAETKTPREITLKFRFKPDSSGTVAHVEVQSVEKLAPVEAYRTLMHVTETADGISAMEYNPNQLKLPTERQMGNTVGAEKIIKIT
ncbi:hypothetical protein DENIS_3479 [Desulfonema ishimotonii]|uniref:Replication terminator protein n=1 Tax=Desulfonema ishimotonii TaxID=45657 RepID=A0A401FZY6_9BACT|nr:hypothetical protein [Desulfonema ishimotonii]GBC62507.1 hypothetical protein DENIS_3479 [Desulfonema ishimotonii]